MKYMVRQLKDRMLVSVRGRIAGTVETLTPGTFLFVNLSDEMAVGDDLEEGIQDLVTYAVGQWT